MNQDLDQIAPAFIAAQAEFLHAVKSKKGGHGSYAPLPEVIELVRPILASHGLAFTQHAIRDERNGIALRTMLVHTSGQTLADDGLFVPAAKLDPQGFGSAMSYARRYGLLGLLGVATHDDDGSDALRAIERQENARTIADTAEPLTPQQRACITAIMSAAGHEHPNLDGKIAEDYTQHLTAAIKYAVKQKVIDAADGTNVLTLGEACDVDGITRELGGVTA